MEQSITLPQFIGLLAAVLQALAYAAYIRIFLKASIRPNAASWAMFGYGTALLVFLEAINGASWDILLLPGTCATMSIVVALLCFRKGATDPVDSFEKRVFLADVILTLAYVGAAFSVGRSGGMSLAFLVAGNVTTLTSFIPIVRSTWRNPDREHAAPWIMWATAYLMLFVGTLWSDLGEHPQLLIYPTISVVLHAAIAVLSLEQRRTSKTYVDASRSIYIASSAVEGKGMFAGIPFDAGQQICVLRGDLKRGPVPSEQGPNWIGIGPGQWIDPQLPLDHINHSCIPNAAFGRKRSLRALRDIGVGEEITMDYSTTETDPDWTMACDCRQTGCRRGLHAIQISFADSLEAPPASPLMQLVWRNRVEVPSATPVFSQFSTLEPVREQRVRLLQPVARRKRPVARNSASKAVKRATGRVG